MADFWVAINCYQEADLLPEAIQSVRASIPDARFVAVDGPYVAFVQQSKLLAAESYSNGRLAQGDALSRFTTPRSDDGTLEILARAGATIIGADQPWPDEPTKRSQYFIGKPGDWYLVLDADERISGKLPSPEVLDRSKDWCIELLRDDQKNTYPVLRFHAHEDGMKYMGAHHALWRGDKLVKRDEISPDYTLPGCHIIHRWCHRAQIDPSRQFVKGAYYRQLAQTESVFRQTHGI